MTVLYILPHADFGPNDGREDAPHFNLFKIVPGIALKVCINKFIILKWKIYSE